MNFADSPEEYKQKLQKLAEAVKSDPNVYIEEITVNKAARTLKRVVLINGEVRKDSGELKEGQEVDGHSIDGRPAKVHSRLISNNSISPFSSSCLIHLQLCWSVGC
jgi:hypothetical protein